MLRALKAYIVAVFIAYLLASVAASQVILAQVTAMGVAVSLTDRLSASLHDLLGLASSYLVLIAVAFALAMPVAAGLHRLLPRQRALFYTLAGFLAIVALHLIMKAVLGVSGIAATRSLPGLLSQGAAGAAGGLCFHALTGRRRN
ncbi:MAG: hypothetical protein ABR612_04650 [Chromatocurvus sp.]